MPGKKMRNALRSVLDDDDQLVEKVIDTIRACLAKNPDSIELFAPGRRLVDKPMSRRQAMKIAAQASGRLSADKARERHLKIWPFIKKLRVERPDISLREIVSALNASSHKPARSKVCNKSSVLFIINKAMEYEDADQSEEAGVRGGKLSQDDGSGIRGSES